MRFSDKRKMRLQEEVQDHIERETEDNIQSGMSPQEARELAQRKFGNTPLMLEKSREIWGALWLEYLLQDLRYALRSLLRVPGYTAVVVLTLALGLGSVTTMLALIDSVLLRPVPLPHPDELVVLYGKAGQEQSQTNLPYSQIEDLRHDGRTLSAVAGYITTATSVSTSDGSRSTVMSIVSPDYFKVLGTHAKMGRLLDSGNAADPVAVVTEEFWQDYLHGNPRVLGSTVKLSGETRTIIGVLPRGLDFPLNGPVVYTPFSLQAKQTGLFSDSALALARLKPGLSVPQALTEVRGYLDNLHHSDGIKSSDLVMVPVTHFLTSSLQTPLLALLGGVSILLFIACANAASLQIARTLERMPEMLIRSALGASFSRILQRLLIESLVLSFGGAAVGGAFALAAIVAIRTTYSDQFPRFHDLAIHPATLAAVVLLATVVGLLASLAPAYNIRCRTTTAPGSRRTTTSRNRGSAVLVTAQITLTCVLLVTCGLFLRTFQALRQVPLGFDPHHVTTLLLMPQNPGQSPDALRQTDNLLLDRLKSLPGVEAAAMQTSIPFSNFSFTMNGRTDVSGRAYQNGDTAYYSVVSSSFVGTSGIQLLQGRGFLPQDDHSGDVVALVNQAFVNKFLAQRNPLGIALRMHRDPGDKDSDIPIAQSFTIVGVVQNEMQGNNLAADFQPLIYLDDLQLPKSSGFLEVYGMINAFAIRSPLAQDILDKEIRAAVKQVAPDMAEMQLQPMEQAIDSSLNQRRLALGMVSSFGAMALILAAIGIYGMLAYTVTSRRREIGVRMALGSTRTRVSRLIMRQAAVMVLSGLAPGIAGAWAAEHAIRSFLFGVKPLDPTALIASAAVLAITAAAAAAVPAWRAARVDPMEVLRIE